MQRVYVGNDALEVSDALLTRALEDTGDDELLRGQVLDTLCWLRGMFRGDLRGGIECAAEAVAIADRVGDAGSADERHRSPRPHAGARGRARGRT